MIASIIFLTLLGIVGIVDFYITYKKRNVRWWHYMFLAISIILIIQSIMAIFCPETLHAIYHM